MVAHNATLRASLRALRVAAVAKAVALSLHEVDSLDWLRVLLDSGCALLKGGSDSLDATSEREVLWLLESAVGNPSRAQPRSLVCGLTESPSRIARRGR